MDVKNRVKEIIADHLKIEPAEIHDDDIISEDLGADSLDSVEMVMGLEEEYNIDIPDSEVADLKTVQEFVNYIESKIANE